MKKFSALIAAALIALSLTVPVYAEPDESSSSVSSEQSVESVTEDSSNPSGDESSSELSSESVEEESVSSSDTSDTSDSQSGSDASTENSSSSSEESSTEPSEESSEPSEKMEESSSDGEKSEEQSEQVSVEELDPSALTYQNYQLDGVNMTISLPDSMYVLTREMAKDDPTLTACKLTKEEVTESFKATDTYIKASAKDFSYDITVQLVKNENTKAINDLTSLEDDELQDVIDNLLKQNIYTGCSKTKFNDTLFLTLDTQYDSSSTNIVGIQEYTIVQGTKVVITFQSYNNEVSPQQKKLLNTIMNSVIFEKTQPEEQPSVVSTKEELDINRLDVRYIYLMAASVIALIFLTSIIVVGLNYRKSKSNSDEKVKEKESIKTDDRQVDPKTSSDTEKKVESEIANTLTIKSVDTYNHDEVKESLSAKIGDIKQKNNMPPQKTDLKEASAPLETKTDEKSATRDENSISSQKSEVKTEQADTKQIPKLEETEQGKVPVSLTKPEKNQSRELEEKNSAVQDEPPKPSENNTDDTTNDDTVFDDVTVVKKPVNPSFEMEGIIFAGGMPSGNVDIEQIQETLDDKETAAAKAEPEKELSAYERRFGKNRTASSYAQSMENTGSNDYSSLAGHSDNISKFEKRFGKLKPVSNENIDFKTDLKKKNELGQNKLQEISKSTEPEKADSLETETPEPEKADSLETETPEPEKADSLETETPEPEKADSLETETPEPEKADSLETETPEPEKADSLETETTEPEKADSLETETTEPEKADSLETETTEPEKADSLETETTEPEKADSLETETTEPEKADSLETETTEPEKADSLETETPEPEKADSLETETTEPEKADSLETETTEPEKADSLETETTEPEKADSLETETTEPEKADSLETATTEPEKADSLETETTELEKADSLETETPEPEKADSLETETTEPEKADSLETATTEPEKADSLETETAEPEKADSLETETPEPEKADSLETETTEPEKADSLETETPEPEKADSLETETPEPEKADSLETETPEPEKAETPETETTEPEKADSLETETPELEKAETPETATEEPAKTDQLEEKMDSRLSVDEITADAPNHKSQTEEEKTMDQKSNEKIGFFAKLKSKLFTAEDDTEFDDIDDDIVYESDNGEGNNLWEKVKNKLKNHPVPEEDSDDLGDDSVIIKPIEKNIEEEKRPENEIYTAEENVVPSNDIELEIGKSEDGKIVIGASAQNAAQQLDTTVKDGSKLLRAADKSAKKPSTDELDQFNENVIYEASDEENTLTYENTPEVDPEWEGKKAVHAEAAIKAAVQALEPRKISGSDEDFFDGVGGEKNAAPQKNDRSAQKRSDEKLKESFRSQTEVRSVEPTETQLRSEPVRSVQPSVGSKPVPSVSPQPKQKTVKPKFIFERDSGIVFEHASAAQQLIEPVDTPFTVIPRLESVNADEYNHRMEELKKSLAKEKKANSGRLGVASANENPYGTTSRYEKRFGNAQPAPDPAQKTPSPLVAKPMPPKTEVKSQQTPVKKKEPPKNTVSNNDATGFYQRYDPTADPFANETYKTEEMLLNEQKKNTENEKSEPNENKSEQAREKAAAAASAVGSMIKRSLKSLLSSEEDDGED